jgi:beta-galactosidase
LVVAPSLNVITDAMAKRLADYVRRGGHLILGPRSGMKDEFNRLDPQRQPGPLAELLGGRVEQFYALDEKVAVGDGTASIWAEQLTPTSPDTRILLTYGKANGWLDGKPAAITRKIGKGSITYVGALVDDHVMDELIGAAVRDAGVTRDFAVPADVELMTRQGQGRSIVILINHGSESRTVALPEAMGDVLAGGQMRSVTLPAQGVAVLSRSVRGKP